MRFYGQMELNLAHGKPQEKTLCYSLFASGSDYSYGTLETEVFDIEASLEEGPVRIDCILAIEVLDIAVVQEGVLSLDQYEDHHH